MLSLTEKSKISVEFFKNLRGRLNYRATGPALRYLAKDLQAIITAAFEKRKKNVQTRQRRRTRSMFVATDSGKQ